VWQEAVPFVVLLVELAEGVRMIGQLVDDAGERVPADGEVRIGAPVRLRWRTDEGDQVLPAWALRPGSAG